MTAGALRIERDPAWWRAIAAHPDLHATGPERIGEIVGRPEVLPLAAAHGGYLFVRLDALGLTAELHSLFTPEGWGREAYEAGIAALGAIWLVGFQSVVTLEMADNPRSRPPRSFGFVRCGGDWKASPFGAARQWMLTRAAWEASPARDLMERRKAKCLH
ncbi:MAG: hypothetical protein KGL69_11085 [Alphaproteobacteria bacterium]|nr:hypothetical protein [Alphaproteobacteria bacterium]